MSGGGGELHFRYSGVSEKPTLLSMQLGRLGVVYASHEVLHLRTNHAYWNLKGHKVPASIAAQSLEIDKFGEVQAASGW